MSTDELLISKPDTTLEMECFEDELSPVQILAYENANELYNEASRTLNKLIANGKILYENNFVSLICVYNDSLSSECLQLLPDDGISNDNAVKQVATTNDDFWLLQNNSYSNCNLRYSTDIVLNSSPIKFFMESVSLPPVMTTVSHSYYSDSTNPAFNPMNSVNKVVMNKDQINTYNRKRIHPILQIEAKPNKILVNVRNETKSNDHLYLHITVTKLMSYDAAQFTEWLLKQGLLYTGQYCRKHRVSGKSRLKMKQNARVRELKFPYSGGYLWVSDCCPSNYISVFKGTIFEGAPHSPIVQIILLYHWSCQTNVPNVMQSENVSASYLRTFYTNLRGVCIAAVHEECKVLLGGKNKMVEVGFISLEIGTGDDSQLHRRVWVLGVLDSESKRIKMQVLRKDNKSPKPKPCENRKLLLPLTKLINRNSIILTDLQLHRNLFTAVGLKNVYQRPIQDRSRKKIYSNENIMSYLRKALPRMFGNTFSTLNQTLIQQFLDELCWREIWGVTSLRAFNSIIDHIGKQTKLCSGVTLSYRLSTIARYPFMNWEYSNWKKNIQNLGKKACKQVSINRNCSEDSSTGNRNNPSTSRVDVMNNKINEQKASKETCIKKMDHNYSLVSNRSLLSTDRLYEVNNKTNEVQKLNHYSNYKPVQELISLESYYYGTIPGSRSMLESERKGLLDMKCVLCGILMKTNICLMKHIINHVFTDNSDGTINDTGWCKYCLIPGSKNHNLVKRHFNDTLLNCAGNHLRSTVPNARCLICETDFKFRTKLILHMHFSHNELELPYECGVCKFRSSQHHIIVDHFYEIHCNGENGQCPLCLKVVAFKDDDGFIITQNIYFFLNHMKKHNCKIMATKCNKCVLSFVNKQLLAYHKRAHHNSCKDISNIKRYVSSTVMMPLPATNSPNKAVVSTTESLDLPKKCSMYKKFSITINIEKAHCNALCCECEGYLASKNHLAGEYACLVCRFKTCCDKAMFEHAINFHNGNRTLNTIGHKKTTLSTTMYCLCGFKSMYGNKLAQHLVYCGKSSAYNTLIDLK